MSDRDQLGFPEPVDTALNRVSSFLLVSASVLAIVVTIPRLVPGIPMGIDTTSHLYKILFLQYWWKRGVNPFWSADWYAGSPALLLYPPLGYYLTACIAMLGLDPLLAYKLVDAFFYCVAPVAIFFLSRELGFSKGESALAALLFSAFPEVIENYLFFDRFPTVLAIPIFSVFIIFFHRALTRRKAAMNLLLSVLSMSALLLVHHLSALIAGIVAVLMVLLAFGAQGLVRPLLKLASVAAATFGVTAFWLMPFLESYSLFSENAFYNRNVLFPFLRFTYFGFDVTSYLLGIAQFALAAVAVQSIVGRNFARIPLPPVMFYAPLLAGMAIFQAGEILPLILLEYLGEFIVAVSFAVFFGQFIMLSFARKLLSIKDGAIFVTFWFALFLWLGLGFYALPILQLPVIDAIWTKTMDVYRLWLYLALPMSALAARGFLRSAAKLLSWRPVSVVLLLALVVIPTTIGVVVKVNYDLNNPVNGVLPYSTANTQIPPAIMNYFRNDDSQGRILGINVPFWIYLMPIYVNKPIVDGWYPQTKLVTQLVQINDYRLDDLETANTTAVRFDEWEGLISQASLLDITWVMIGDNGSLAAALMGGAGFAKQLVVPYGNLDLVVYKSMQTQSYVDGDVNVTEISRPNPDQINIDIQPTEVVTKLLVKEAYFRTWRATADGWPVTVNDDQGTGYILLTLPPATREVMLYQEPNDIIWSAISIITLLAILVALAMFRRRRKNSCSAEGVTYC
jgi:hypothetical protein